MNIPLRKPCCVAVLLAVALPVVACVARADDAKEKSVWRNRLIKQGKVNSPLVEVTPFVFKGRFYMLENWQKQWETGERDGSLFHEDEIRIRDMQTERIVSTPLLGHGLGMAFVWQDRVYVFAGDWGVRTREKWHIKNINMISSSDLKNWSKSVVVLTANPDETFFNVSVCRGDGRFTLLVETNDPRWPPFTFKYFTSSDLLHWKRVPEALYGTKKYVGGPALYFEDGYYYTLYLHAVHVHGKSKYETRITRSKDLVHWQDAPRGRPFVTFNPENRVHPLRPKEIRERNASDAEAVYWKGKTLVYFTGGDQHYAGDLQWAQFDGTPRELFDSFFDE